MIVLISACLIKAWYVPKIVHAKQTTKEETGWKKQIGLGGHGDDDELYHWPQQTAQQDVNNAKNTTLN